MSFFAISWELLPNEETLGFPLNQRRTLLEILLKDWAKLADSETKTLLDHFSIQITDLFSYAPSKPQGMPSTWFASNILESKLKFNKSLLKSLIEPLQKIIASSSTTNKYYAACILVCLTPSPVSKENAPFTLIDIHIIEEAATFDFSPAAYLLGLHYETSLYLTKSHKHMRASIPSREEIQSAIEKNRSHMTNSISHYHKALKYYEMAAIQEFAFAELKLAILLEKGAENHFYQNELSLPQNTSDITLPRLDLAVLGLKAYCEYHHFNHIIAPNLEKSLRLYLQAKKNPLFPSEILEDKEDPRNKIDHCIANIKKKLQALPIESPRDSDKEDQERILDAAREYANALHDLGFEGTFEAYLKNNLGTDQVHSEHLELSSGNLFDWCRIT